MAARTRITGRSALQGAARALASLAVAALLGVAPARAAESPARVEIEEPRAFGYTVGDLLERRAVIEVKEPYRLAEDALPKPGRTGAWLDLLPPQLSAVPVAGGTRYELRLRYQVVNAPREIVTLMLPAVSLALGGGERPLAEALPDWPFTLAPLTPETILARGPLEEMQPDAAPPPVATGAIEARLAGYALAAAALLLFLAYRLWGLPFVRRSRGPFARACRDVSHLTRSAGAEARREALRRVHRAFDETAGRALFKAEVPDFIARHPRYAPLAAEIERFFEQSRREFFAEGAGEPGLLDWLAGLCRDCRAVERGTR